MSHHNQHNGLADPRREEAAHLARVPATGWRERERLKEVSSWLEMAGAEQPASLRRRRETASELRGRVDRLFRPPVGLMVLIASTIFAAGLLLQAARGLPG
jgi:hypothetical protein